MENKSKLPNPTGLLTEELGIAEQLSYNGVAPDPIFPTPTQKKK